MAGVAAQVKLAFRELKIEAELFLLEISIKMGSGGLRLRNLLFVV